MRINKSNLQFLDGFLNALSSVDGNIGDYTMTAIVIRNSNHELSSTIADFYDLPYDKKSLKSEKIEFYAVEKFINERILQRPFGNLINYDKNRNALLSYKIMDYIEYCFDDFFNLNTKDIEVFDIKVNFDKKKAEFLAIPIDNDKNIFIISFWEKLK